MVCLLPFGLPQFGSRRVAALLGACFFFIPVLAKGAVTNVTYGFPFFNPKVVAIQAGDTVNWVNGPGGHTLLGKGADPMCGGASLPCSHTFNVPGSYAYECTVGSHAALGMTGLVVVAAAPLTPPMLTNATMLPQGWLRFTVLSSGTSTNVIFASTNLVAPAGEWVPLGTNAAKTNKLIFTDTNAVDYARRFYRVLAR
jgi:hypothetical protein